MADGGFMKVFLQLSIAAFVGLLSWWQVELYRGLSMVTIMMLAAGAAAAMLSWKSMRAGYRLSVLVGVGYLLELLWLAPHGSLGPLQPLLAWAAGLIGSGGWLLWSARERAAKPPAYERHPEY